MTWAEWAYAGYSAVLQGVCLAGAALLAVSVVLILAERAVDWAGIRRLFRSDRVGFAMALVFIAGMVHYGATKEEPQFTFSDGIRDAGGTYASSGVVHIEWVRDTTTMIVPLSATVYIDCRKKGSSDEWTTLAETTVGAWSWHGSLADSDTYVYHIWVYYVPPEPVHTNGVWVYKTFRDRFQREVIPVRSRVEGDGKAISTPLQKRKDEE